MAEDCSLHCVSSINNQREKLRTLISRIAIPPLFLCLGLTTLVGSGAIAGTGILYGMQVIGKKASANDMASAARGDGEPDEKNIMDDGDWQTNP